MSNKDFLKETITNLQEYLLGSYAKIEESEETIEFVNTLLRNLCKKVHFLPMEPYRFSKPCFDKFSWWSGGYKWYPAIITSSDEHMLNDRMILGISLYTVSLFTKEEVLSFDIPLTYSRMSYSAEAKFRYEKCISHIPLLLSEYSEFIVESKF